MGKFLGTVGLPEVASLPAAGTRGRLFTLTTNNHVYHDNGASWDDLNTSAGGSTVLSEVEVNLSSTVPVSNGSFTITGSGLTTNKLIHIQQSPGPYTGKGTYTDEIEFDQITATGYVFDATTIKCNWGCNTLVRGNTKFSYFVSG